jgi:hypothetical protein
VVKEDASVLWRVAYDDRPSPRARVVAARGTTSTRKQVTAVASISATLDSKAFAAHLLHGTSPAPA